MIKKLAVLGSTGSIGQSTLGIVRDYPEKFQVILLSGHKNTAELEKQIQEFRPKKVIVTDKESHYTLKKRGYASISNSWEPGFTGAFRDPEIDLVVNGLVGFAGFPPTIEALKNKKDVAIANKESLVIGGTVLKRLTKETGRTLIPIDSEHNAILSLMRGRRASEIHKIILTSSGGPFRTRPHAEFPDITITEALQHPTWAMGKKISIDSATLLNKGFEVIEAHHLFGKALQDISVIIHKESLIHALIETIDGQIYAQIGPKDMKFPILNALNYPEISSNNYERISLSELGGLTFEAVDHRRFPLLRTAYTVGELGGLYPCILNAANEVLVEAFLEGRISYLDIPHMIHHILETHRRQDVANTDPSFEDIAAQDRETRKETRVLITEKKRSQCKT